MQIILYVNILKICLSAYINTYVLLGFILIFVNNLLFSLDFKYEFIRSKNVLFFTGRINHVNDGNIDLL